MALDKWQEREAQQYATDNNVTYKEAVDYLFPEGDAAPAEVVNPAEAPADDPAKVDTTKK